MATDSYSAPPGWIYSGHVDKRKTTVSKGSLQIKWKKKTQKERVAKLFFWHWPRRLCVRHPRWCLQCVAIVITNFQSVFTVLAKAACVRHACLCAACVAWPLLLPSFSLSFFLFLFFSLLLLTHFGETPESF